MKTQQFFLNAVMISSLIFVFCCTGSKQVVSEKDKVPQKEINYIPYYLKVYEADSLYLTGNYERSFEILDSLFKEYEPLNQLQTRELETFAKVAYLTGNFKKIKPTFKKLFDTWGYEQSNIEYDSIMAVAWVKVNLDENEINQWQREYMHKINWTLRDTIITMTKNDQLYRRKVREKEDSIDISHKELIKFIFNKYGYPDYRLVGFPKYGEMTDLGMIFLHIFNQLNENEYEYFRKQLYKFIKEGRASPEYLANIVDRTAFTFKNSTEYGTYGTHESWGDKQVKFDTVKIARNRKSIGLPSLWYQEFKWK